VEAVKLKRLTTMARRKGEYITTVSRMILIKSVTSAMPMLYLSLFKMSNALIKKIVNI